ncbi:hypothetical protein EDD11_004128 [Mortierella claussenii]|nr:hypothetical protein EDD11_004128 [Mortierella claussenii]
MADDLVRVIQANENLRSLQLRPQGRIPSRLLDALSKLEHLEALSLDAWQDFQEYSLQLIMDACPGLARLSLGQNDFTRFTLETLQGSDRRPTLRLRASGSPEVDKTDARLGLERFDDPIKGRSTAFDSSTQFPLEMHSKRAVLYTSAVIPAHPTVPITTHQQQTFNQFKKRCPSVAPQNQIRTLSLHHSGLRQEFLVNLAQQCPQLEHLSLLDGWGFYPSTRFASILSQACPHLSRIEFREQTLDLQDEFFVSLCQHIPRLQWIHAGRTGFSQGALNAVRMRCSNMVSLNLDGARGIQSQALNQLLETCESLKVLSAQGVVLNGRDVSDGSNWVCRELETLVLDIEIYAVVEPVGPSATLSLSKSPDSVVTVDKTAHAWFRRWTSGRKRAGGRRGFDFEKRLGGPSDAALSRAIGSETDAAITEQRGPGMDGAALAPALVPRCYQEPGDTLWSRRKRWRSAGYAE